jgi:hypothetical protein
MGFSIGMSTPIYRRLENDEDSIRLLEILAGPKYSPIRTKLHLRRLSSQVRFEAISYTWGNDNDSVTIIVDAQPVKIRRNLWKFLSVLRKSDEPRLVWVDAICISQTDLIEKAYQVQMIGKTFSSATQTVAWLGDEADGSADLIEQMSVPSELRPKLEYPAIGKSPFKGELKARFDLMEAFSARPYWRRTWIVEEYVLSRDIVFFCGSKCIAVKQLEDYVGWIRGPAVLNLGLPKSSIIQLISARRKFQIPVYHPTGSGIVLRDLINSFHDTEGVEPRDKIFALRPIARFTIADQVLSSIPVDYTVDLMSLYLAVCGTWMLYDESHDGNERTYNHQAMGCLASVFGFKTADLQRAHGLVSARLLLQPGDVKLTRLKRFFDWKFTKLTLPEQEKIQNSSTVRNLWRFTQVRQLRTPNR